MLQVSTQAWESKCSLTTLNDSNVRNSCSFWKLCYVAGWSFNPIGLHATDAASDWFLVKRSCTASAKTTIFCTEFAPSFIFVPQNTLWVESTKLTTNAKDRMVPILWSSYLAGMSPYISLKIKKRHYEHHMIEAHNIWLHRLAMIFFWK